MMQDKVELQRSLGFNPGATEDTLKQQRKQLLQYINLQLIASGQPHAEESDDGHFADVARGLLDQHQALARLLSDYRCPIDKRIEDFLSEYFSDLDLNDDVRVPAHTLIVDRHGMARELALPADENEFHTDIIESYRVRNGVLHNPRHDRRTTKGTFHVTEGGLPIPDDKRSVPKHVFAQLLLRAFSPPEELLRLPFTSKKHNKPSASFLYCYAPLFVRKCWTSLIRSRWRFASLLRVRWSAI